MNIRFSCGLFVSAMALATCLCGCVAVPCGHGEYELPGRVSGLPDVSVAVERFDGILATAKRDGAAVDISFVAKGDFISHKEPSRVFSVPKKVAIGLFPGMKVPEPSWLADSFPNKFFRGYMMFCCSIWVFPFVDSIFIEPFSAFQSDVTDWNVAQLAALGCCKYLDVPNRKLVREVEHDVEDEHSSEYKFSDCTLLFHFSNGFGVRQTAPVPMKDGHALVNALMFTNMEKGGCLSVSFKTLPPVGGDLGKIIETQCENRRFDIQIE